jgi:hypothetical protein
MNKYKYLEIVEMSSGKTIDVIDFTDKPETELITTEKNINKEIDKKKYYTNERLTNRRLKL